MTGTLTARDLAGALADAGAVRSRWLQRAFEETPREVFVSRYYRSDAGVTVLVDGTDPRQRDEWLRGIYTDQCLVVQMTRTPDMVGELGAPTSSSSMPTVMAAMLEALDLQPGHRVLEIGTGTGYNAALLCHRVGAENVVSVELDPGLAGAAERALAELGLRPAVRVGDGAAGVAEAAPFDRILATAATDRVPPSWVTQLAPGGVIVAELRGSLAGALVRLTAVGSDAVEGRVLTPPVAFMPMRTRLDSPHRDGEDWDRVLLDQRNPQRGTTALDPGTVADHRSLRFLLQLHLAGSWLRGFLRSPDGREVTAHSTDGSWVSVQLTAVAQGGPRRLWDTVESCHALWLRLGEPGVERFGVTAPDVEDLQFGWLDGPDSGYRWPLPL